jgi:hypothetical protein
MVLQASVLLPHHSLSPEVVNLPKGSVSLAIVGTRPRRKVPGNNFSNFKVCQEMLGFSALGYKIIRNHWKKKKLLQI